MLRGNCPRTHLFQWFLGWWLVKDYSITSDFWECSSAETDPRQTNCYYHIEKKWHFDRGLFRLTNFLNFFLRMKYVTHLMAKKYQGLLSSTVCKRVTPYPSCLDIKNQPLHFGLLRTIAFQLVSLQLYNKNTKRQPSKASTQQCGSIDKGHWPRRLYLFEWWQTSSDTHRTTLSKRVPESKRSFDTPYQIFLHLRLP